MADYSVVIPQPKRERVVMGPPSKRPKNYVSPASQIRVSPRPNTRPAATATTGRRPNRKAYVETMRGPATINRNAQKMMPTGRE
jgi:hypothetical protein